MYTDSDVVMGVATSRTDLFVATLRGVLRYPLAGGAATRMTTRNGLTDDRVFAISSSPDGVTWAATAGGVVRLSGETWSGVGFAQPDVGRATALLALDGGGVLLGGAQGIARYDGRWLKLTDRYQVMSFARDANRVLVATAQSGVLAFREDFSALEEFGTTAGIPDTLARNVVPAGSGRFWALLQGSNGSRLEYFDGHRFFGYTHASIRGPWLSLIASPRGAGKAALVVQGQLYEIVPSGGESLSVTDAGSPDTQRRVEVHPEEVDPPAAPPPTPSSRGGGRSSVQVAAAAQPAPGAAAATPREPPPRPRNIPSFAAPIEVLSSGAPSGAPRFGLQPIENITLPEDVASVASDGTAIYVARAGLGVSRVAGGEAVDFRTHDLALQRRSLSLATDGNGSVWFVPDDGGAVKFDGRRFSREALDPDPTVVPLIFWSRGIVAAAVARVGTNTIRAYRFADNGWQSVTERRIDTGGPGSVDARFLSVDDRGRFWVGIRVIERDGHIRERGVALIDGNLPGVTQFHAPRAPRNRRAAAPRSNASPSVPDDVSAIEFENSGTAWLAGTSGATSIAPAAPGTRGAATVRTFNETSGVRGDQVSDLSLGPSGRIYVATPEGLGYFENQRFNFDIEGGSSAAHVIALAWDPNGTLWGAGPRGAWGYNGREFRTLAQSDGVPSEGLLDVAVDGSSRVWFVGPAGIYVLGSQSTASDSSSSSSGGEAAGL